MKQLNTICTNSFKQEYTSKLFKQRDNSKIIHYQTTKIKYAENKGFGDLVYYVEDKNNEHRK